VQIKQKNLKKQHEDAEIMNSPQSFFLAEQLLSRATYLPLLAVFEIPDLRKEFFHSFIIGVAQSGMIVLQKYCPE